MLHMRALCAAQWGLDCVRAREDWSHKSFV
jgi:hypothetical protein